MPEISAFCPGCGRAVTNDSDSEVEPDIPVVEPLSRDALLGALAYFTVVPAIVVLLVPAIRRYRYVRFNSWQSVLFLATTIVIGGLTRLAFAALSIFPFVGFLLAWLLAGLVSLAFVFLWIAITIKAALGDAIALPVIGRWSERLAERW
jgi:uncharacterized membrane protein